MFNPFHKQLAELKLDDLSVLKSVSEGLFVEYKSELPNPKEIARSVSSFANQEGGLLFYGVKGAKKQDGFNCAESFPGLASVEGLRIMDRVRDAVTAHCQPVPPFERFQLRGPAEELPIAPDRTVVLVAVKRGMDAPYVHSSGRIFRRVADSTDPIPERDRHALDLLWSRREKGLARLRVALSYDPPRLGSERDRLSLLRLFLFSDPFGDRGHVNRLAFSQLREVLADASVATGGMPFDNIFATENGAFGRHARHNDPRATIPSLRFNGDCSAVATIPLNSGSFESPPEMRRWMARYRHAEPFSAQCAQGNLRKVEVIDLNAAIPALGAMVSKYRALLRVNGVTEEDISFKLLASNVAGRTPFLDVAAYMRFVQLNGVPVIQEHAAWAPVSESPEFLGAFEPDVEVGAADDDPHVKAGVKDMARMLSAMLPILGVPLDVAVEDIGDVMDAITAGIEGGLPASELR